ncbi:N-acetyltransferase 9 [Phytophthora boehmeriae]|uniref:N-acetyltransferase 9 n=1 Tax=Phytophthora boehmeriae TaxID=109152 RepID=A0A8T1WST3_9STRA|nr:N-acetyltransferase 9 [Phytophthora boehmeriae]
MTASEPLTLDEEFEMQQSWREDDKKCTFIVLATAEGDCKSGASYVDESALNRMAGDVNLFFNDYDDPLACEIEVMIAEEKYRRKGFAEEAVKLMMAYATSKLNVTRFFCKINDSNDASLQLFNKLGYVKCNYVAAFQEVEMELLPKDRRAEIVDAVLKSAVIHSAHLTQ